MRIGWFVKRGENDIILMNSRGDTWPESNVTYAISAWGYAVDGESFGIQPAVLNPVTGATVIEPDKVLYALIGGNPRTPVVLGVLPGAGRIDDIPARPVLDPARKASIAVVRNQSTGVVQGSVRTVVNDGNVVSTLVELRDAAGNPQTTVEADLDTVRVERGPQASVEMTANSVTLTQGATTITMQNSTVTVDIGGTSYSLVDTRALDRIAGMMGQLATAVATIPYVLPPTFVTDIAALAAHADATIVLKAQ